MRALITGSSGMVGKHLIAELKNRGHTVREFDIAAKQDVLNKEHVADAVRNIDVIFHLAAIIEDNHPEVRKVNVLGTRNLLEEAARRKVKKFVYLSSTGVYGFTRGEINEESEVRPENNYERSKLEAEKLALGYQEEMCVTIVRSAMVLGPNKYWKNMFRLVEKNYPLPCSGKNTFQIIYASNLANALILAAEKGESGETYLASGEEKVTLNKFCEISKEALGKKGPVRHMHTGVALLFGKLMGNKVMNKDNIRHLSKERQYNISKIKKLGYKQRFNLQESIFKTLEEIKEIDAR